MINVRAHDDPVSPGWVTVAVMLATLMQVIDTTIANVALPHLQGALSATTDQVSWVLTSYIVAAAIMTPPTGWLAARLGRRRLFVIAIIGFTIASFLCGVATSLGEIVAFRLLQGACGAALVPLSQAILLDTYPKEKHGVAMAMWGIGVMLGPILGPTLGGWITEYYSWRWVFFINVPVGVIAALLTLGVVPETAKVRDRPFDAIGFLLLSAGVGALQLMLDRGQGEDWFSSPEILTYAAVVGLGLWSFLVHAWHAEHPFVDLSVFRDRNFTTSAILMFAVGMVLLSSMALLPPLLQHLLGYSAVDTGLLLAPRGVGAMATMMIVSRVIGRIDARWPVAAGFVIIAFALHWMSTFSPQVDTASIVWSGLVQGLGMGLVFVPLSTLAFSTLAPAMRTEAAGMFNLARNIGMSAGVSVVFTVLTRSTQVNHAELAAHLTPWSTAADGIAPATLNGLVTAQALWISYLNDFTLLMALSLATLPLVMLLQRPPRAAPPPGAKAPDEPAAAGAAAD